MRRDDGFAEAGRHRLSEGDRDDVQRARCHAIQRVEEQASPSRSVAVRVNADRTNDVAHVSLTSGLENFVEQLKQLLALGER